MYYYYYENNWYSFDANKTNLENVLGLIETVPHRLEILFQRKPFRDLLDADKVNYGIDATLFEQAFAEAKATLDEELVVFRTSIINDSAFLSNAESVVSRIGFSGSSFELKLNLLNKLWREANVVGLRTANLLDGIVGKAIRKLLAFLNSLLGSLKELVPGLDGIKELKEVAESYLSAGDE